MRAVNSSPSIRLFWCDEPLVCCTGNTHRNACHLVDDRLRRGDPGELLDGLQIDRTSCCRFWANQLRVLMTAAASA